jgi:hypothetical protein
MPLKTLGPIGPRAVGERVKKKFITFSRDIQLITEKMFSGYQKHDVYYRIILY